MKCPCCNGTGEIEPRAPVHLSRLQMRIWHFVRRSGYGIATSDLTDRVYADRPDGGPVSARRCVWVLVMGTNKRLAAVKQRIVSTGGVYRLEHFE